MEAASMRLGTLTAHVRTAEAAMAWEALRRSRAAARLASTWSIGDEGGGRGAWCMSLATDEARLLSL